ncbi:MAG: hypothetical protein R3B36_28285 [Polyangiaceae bacterium]
MTDLRAATHARPVLGAVGWVVLAAATSAVAMLACGGDETGGKGAKSAADARRTEVLVHEPCNESGRVQTMDANNDGKPDIRKVMDGNREVCRVTDLNNDGHPDMYEYFDSAGQLRRREYDYDDNGILNAVELFQGGKLVERQLDTTNRGRVDTWDYFDPATGKRTKRERDASGDGRVDQWWLYEADHVTIAMDRNGDGNPDPQATIVLDKNGAPVASASPGIKPPVDADAGAVPPPPPPPEAPAAPANPDDGPALAVPDAGVPGKPARPAGAKR